MSKKQETPREFELRLARLVSRPVFWNIFHLVCLITILVGIVGNYADWGFLYAFGYWTVSVGAVWLGCVLLIAVIYYTPICFPRYMRLLPMTWQKSYYLVMKERMLKHEFHPLIDFPFHIWVAMHLDKEFAKGGYAGAEDAASNWVEHYTHNLQSSLNQICKDLPQNEA